MRDDTVTPSERVPFKIFSPCQKPPPLHAELSGWVCGWVGGETMGQVVPNQHFKAAPVSIIQSRAPCSLCTWVSFDYRDLRSICVTSEDDITLPGSLG